MDWKVQKLSFVPLPLISESDENKLAEFSDLMATKFMKDRPSSKSKPDSHSQENKSRKDCKLHCQECFKPHCVFSKSKLLPFKKSAIHDLQDSRLFTHRR